jgi:hypothetical protein
MTQLDEVDELPGLERELYGRDSGVSLASEVVGLEDIPPPTRRVRLKPQRKRIRAASANLRAYIVLPELTAEGACYQEVGIKPQDMEATETLVADTKTVLLVSQLAKLLDSVSRPTTSESPQVSFDPDDYPLF